ncbi:OprO/OprP family phosphate-selective porin [Parabacteroides sp. OttesenSCG-928-B22]|nr:OprO/OprP family phosphate-selective porin [Parabacteroides sp. OttesenSCG-928-B22]
MSKYFFAAIIAWLTWTTALQAQSISNHEYESTIAQIANTVKERIRISGYGQVGYTFDSQQEVNNEFEVKRIVLTTKANVTDQWIFHFVYNFRNGGTLQEFYTDYHIMPGLSLRLGQFKVPYTIENPMSLTIVELINSYSQATNYLAGVNSSDLLYGSNGGRDVGVMIYGDFWKERLSYRIGLFNGQGINTKDKNNQKDWIGSITLKPLKWLSLNGSFMKGKGHAVAASIYNDINVGENYRRDRWSGGIVIQSKRIDFRAEYLKGIDGKVRSEGCYTNITAHLFPKFDVIVSYDYLNKNKKMDARQTNYIGGIQYFFYPKCRLQAQYIFRHQNENSNIIQAQIQVAF